MRKKLLGGFLAFLFLLALLFLAVNFYVNKKVEERLNVVISKLQPYADVYYQTVNYSLLTRELTIRGLSVRYADSTGHPVNVNSFTIRKFDDKHDIPYFAEVELKGISFYTDSLPEKDRLVLKALGYGDRMNADFSLAYRYEPEKKKLAVKRFDYRLKDVGELTAELELDNFRPFNEENALYFILGGWMDLRFGGGKLIYTDEGLFNRTITLLAVGEHITPEQTKARIIRKIKDWANRSGNSSYSRMVSEALIKFILKPRSIVIEAKPEHSLSFGEILALDSPEEIFSKLNVKVNSY
ncbi:hypothetical protein [Desulfurobacterium sp.]